MLIVLEKYTLSCKNDETPVLQVPASHSKTVAHAAVGDYLVVQDMAYQILSIDTDEDGNQTGFRVRETY